MTWNTPCKTYRTFRSLLQRDPMIVRVDGFHGGRYISLTLETLLEERESFYVEGPGGNWRAYVFRDRELSWKPRSYPVKSRYRTRDNPTK